MENWQILSNLTEILYVLQCIRIQHWLSEIHFRWRCAHNTWFTVPRSAKRTPLLRISQPAVRFALCVVPNRSSVRALRAKMDLCAVWYVHESQVQYCIWQTENEKFSPRAAAERLNTHKLHTHKHIHTLRTGVGITFVSYFHWSAIRSLDSWLMLANKVKIYKKDTKVLRTLYDKRTVAMNRLG